MRPLHVIKPFSAVKSRWNTRWQQIVNLSQWLMQTFLLRQKRHCSQRSRLIINIYQIISRLSQVPGQTSNSHAALRARTVRVRSNWTANNSRNWKEADNWICWKQNPGTWGTPSKFDPSFRLSWTVREKVLFREWIEDGNYWR